MTRYEIWVLSPTGVLLAVLPHPLRLVYRRVLNDPGYVAADDVLNRMPLRLTLPASDWHPAWWQPDLRLLLWRLPPGGGAPTLATNTAWLVQQVRWQYPPGTTRSTGATVTLGAVPALDLLARRVVVPPADNPAAQHTAPADDLIKWYADACLGSTVHDLDRRLTGWLSLDPPTGAAPSVTKQAAWRNLLTVAQELAAAATQQGTPLCFDVVAPTTQTLLLRTFIGTRGTDHSRTATPLVLPLADVPGVQVSQTWEDSSTVAYVTGASSDPAPPPITVPAAPGGLVGPFARREVALAAPTLHDAAALAAEGAALLTRRRVRTRVQFAVPPALGYGHRWQWGDCLALDVAGQRLTATISAVQVTYTPTASGGDGEQVQVVATVA